MGGGGCSAPCHVIWESLYPSSEKAVWEFLILPGISFYLESWYAGQLVSHPVWHFCVIFVSGFFVDWCSNFWYSQAPGEAFAQAWICNLGPPPKFVINELDHHRLANRHYLQLWPRKTLFSPTLAIFLISCVFFILFYCVFLLCDFFDFFREIFNEQEKFSILTSFFLAPNFFAKVLSSFDLWPIKYCIFLHNQKFSLEEAKFFTVPAKKKWTSCWTLRELICNWSILLHSVLFDLFSFCTPFFRRSVLRPPPIYPWICMNCASRCSK